MTDAQESPVPSGKQKLRYANALHAPVAAAINELYRFRDKVHALARLEYLRAQYTHVSERADWADAPGDEPQLLLWIRNYELSPEDELAGYLGHYARITCCRLDDEDGYYSLRAEKIERALKFHPQRKRPQARCPNWGHPILRGVKKGKQHPTLESANAELTQLHLEYPETTIPGENKLYLMIFSREESPAQPLQKYVFEIQHVQGGGFTIESRKNAYKKQVSSRPPQEDAPAPLGHFSSMVALKKRKRKT